MASGKKNYFRHSFLARNDDFIEGMIDKFGLAGYYYWFALVEICAEQCADEMQKYCKFHESRLFRELKCNSRRLQPVLDYMQTSRKLVYNKTEKYYEIEILNLPKYMGKYQIKKEPKPSNKSKEKESKRNKNINTKITPDDVVQIYNNALGEKLGYCRGLGSDKHLKNFLEATQWLQSENDWRELFTKCEKSSYLMGDDGGWRVNLTWLVNYDNAIKVLNGNFDFDEKQDKAKNTFTWTPSDDVLRACGEIE